MNESIYYNVDELHQAIGKNVQIRFQYYQWNVKKEMELRRDGAYYQISPWELMWDDENYYLLGYDAEASKIKHYRVDKMLRISLTNDKREGRELFEKFDLAAYAKKHFGMFDGEEQTVKLVCANHFAGVIIDRFGKDVSLRKVDDEHFSVNVDVAVSGQFIGWVVALGDGVKIVGPESVVERMRQEGQRICEMYK